MTGQSPRQNGRGASPRPAPRAAVLRGPGRERPVAVTEAEGPEEIRARLEALIAGGRLRGASAALGAELLAGLDAPAKVVLAGPAVDTARALANALAYATAGARADLATDLAAGPLLPEALWLPDVLIRHGAAPQTLSRHEDGRERLWQGHPLEELLDKAPLALVLEAPLPALTRMSLVLPAASPDPAGQTAALLRAAPGADLTLWCSAGFAEAEAALWAGAPAELRANAWLCTGGGSKAPPGFAGRLDAAAPELAAGAVLAMVSSGLAARLDHALLFLARYAPAANPRRAPGSALHARSAPADAAAEGAAPAPPARVPAPSGDLAPADPAPGFAADALAAALSDAPGPVDLAPAEPAEGGYRAMASARLRAGGVQLLAILPGAGGAAVDAVFGECLAALDALTAPGSEDPGPEETDLVLDGLDALYLLRGEGGVERALEGLSLLLQLRRELEVEAPL